MEGVAMPTYHPLNAPDSARPAPVWLPALAIGVAAGLLVYFATAERAVLVNDEGIFLQGGANVLRGAIPYRDFFGVTGPGTIWLLAAIFRLAGVTLRSARLLLAIDFSILIGLTYWVASRLARPGAALGGALLCAALFFSSPNHLLINHRWDCSAAQLGAISMALSAIQSQRRKAAFLAGAFSVLAAWITPPAGLVGVVIALRICIDGKTRRLVPFYAAGAAVCLIVPAAVLAFQGGLTPMFQAMFWNASNYSSANRVPYGFFFGGPAALFAGVRGAEWIQRILLAGPFLLPALLPPAVTLAWLPALRSPRRPELFLLACGAAAVLSNYPRWDLFHLLCIAPLFLALAAARIDRLRSGPTRVAVLLLFLLPAAEMSWLNLSADDRVAIDSPAGRIRVSEPAARAIQMTLSHVRPGATLFVFPYEPIFYFLTNARNPTRYLWLQPGMMSGQDERTALSELNANPPQWVLYHDMPPAYYLRIWPGADPSRLRINSIEEFIRARYQLCDSARGPDGERQLMERR